MNDQVSGIGKIEDVIMLRVMVDDLPEVDLCIIRYGIIRRGQFCILTLCIYSFHGCA